MSVHWTASAADSRFLFYIMKNFTISTIKWSRDDVSDRKLASPWAKEPVWSFKLDFGLFLKNKLCHKHKLMIPAGLITFTFEHHFCDFWSKKKKVPHQMISTYILLIFNLQKCVNDVYLNPVTDCNQIFTQALYLSATLRCCFEYLRVLLLRPIHFTPLHTFANKLPSVELITFQITSCIRAVHLKKEITLILIMRNIYLDTLWRF